MNEGNNQSSCPDVGNYLRKAREHKGISIEDAAQELHLRPSIVQAIENNQFKELPGTTFLKGYVKSYARILGVSEEQVLSQLQQALDFESGIQNANDESQRSSKTMIGLLSVLVMVALLGGGFYLFQTDQIPFDNATTDYRLKSDSDISNQSLSNLNTSDSSAAYTASEQGEDQTIAEADNVKDIAAEVVIDSVDSGESVLKATFEDVDESANTSREEKIEAVEVESANELVIASDTPAGEEGVVSVSIESHEETAAETITESLVTTEVKNDQEQETTPDPAIEEINSDVPEETASANESETPLNVSQTEEANSSSQEDAAFGELVAKFSGDCWFQVKNGEGRTVISSLKRSGDVSKYSGVLPLKVIIGAASEVDIQFNGQSVDISKYRIRNNRTEFELK